MSRYPWYDFPANFEETFEVDYLKGTFDDDPPPGKLEFILRQYGGLLLKKKDEEQFQRYWPGFVKLEPLNWAFGVPDDRLEPVDSGWRVYLSIVMQRINAREERIKALDSFFFEYADIIHK